MDIKQIVVDFVSSFLIVLVVASIVTYLWNEIFHDSGNIDWETAFRLAIIFGIMLPWIRIRTKKE